MVGENRHDKQATVIPTGKISTLILIMCTSFANGVWAQQLKIPKIAITPEPVGSGARALGQSAFIAVVDDATAASWNPAGLINLENPEASVVGAWRTVTKDYTVFDGTEPIDQDNWHSSQINFMSYAYPIRTSNINAVISVNYHQVYNFDVEFNDSITFDDPSLGTVLGQFTGKSEGAVSAYTVAGGLSIPSCPQLTIGGGVNWYRHSLFDGYAWRSSRTGKAKFSLPGVPDLEFTETETFDNFSAYNFTLGALWDAYEKQENLLSVGVVFHTPYTAKVDRELVSVQSFDGILVGQYHSSSDVEIDFPLSLGAGLNYRFTDRFSMAFDTEWKQWSRYKLKYGDTTWESPIDEDTLAFRLGGEYLSFLDYRQWVLAYRAGAFYEPRPAANEPELLPVYGLSGGFGWTIREQLSLDFAYQHRWAEQELSNVDYKINEDFFVISLILYFPNE
jgi:long-subunit fatty acid transport protein